MCKIRERESYEMKLKTRLHKKILLSLNDINSCKVDHVPAVRSNVCNGGGAGFMWRQSQSPEDGTGGGE